MSVRRLRRPCAVVAVLALVLLFAGACSGGSSTAPAGAPTSPAAGPDSAPPTGTVVVSAAASLTEAFNKGKAWLTTTRPGLRITYAFGGSNALATQILQGAPADVFASADEANMAKLVMAGRVDAPVTFARNRLEIAVAPGNPRHIGTLGDLGRPGTSVVLEAPGVPAGDYTRQALVSAGAVVNPRSLEADVKSAITKVSSGEADATVVYVTDVSAAGSSVEGIAIPDADNVVATYPMAVVKDTKNRAGAEAFVRSATTGEIQQALRAAGFLAP